MSNRKGNVGIIAPYKTSSGIGAKPILQGYDEGEDTFGN